ncbi:6470_t:CDS:2, partial [Gigaspora rosea]
SFIITSMPWVNITPIMGLPRRTASTACIYGEDKNRIIYIGGANMVGDNFTAIFDITNQQWNTLNLNWTEFSPGPVAPIGIQGYSATLYIGGQPGGDLSMYNINNDSWSIVTTSGDIPPSRYDHGAVFI